MWRSTCKRVSMEATGDQGGGNVPTKAVKKMTDSKK